MAGPIAPIVMRPLKQVAESQLVVHRHMQIPTRDGDVRVAGSVSDFGQRSAANKDVTYERVSAVVNGQAF